MIHQLRINEIFEDRKDAFHARFRDHDARIMRRYGFHIVAMWEAKMDKRTEFVYLLEWRDERTKANHGRLLWTIASGRRPNALHRPKAVRWSAR